MQTYDKKKASEPAAKRGRMTSPIDQGVSNAGMMSMSGMSDGASRIDLPEMIRSKMEESFGTDLSSVKLYQSQKVADQGAQAVAFGNTIAFAPGKFDMSSQSGQALLGHELSHVVSQQRGEVSGSGVLNDYALEARADREGAMAAAGEQIYSGPVTAPMSAASPAAMAGPMQCKKNKGKNEGLGKHLGANDGNLSAALTSKARADWAAGDHSYAGAKADFAAHYPKAKKSRIKSFFGGLFGSGGPSVQAGIDETNAAKAEYAALMAKKDLL